MLKKTMLVVGVLAAATIAMSGNASAFPHRLSNHYGMRAAAYRAPRAVFRAPRVHLAFRAPRVHLAFRAPRARLAFRAPRVRLAFAHHGFLRHLAGPRPHLSRRFAGLRHRLYTSRVAASRLMATAPAGGAVQTGSASFYSGGGRTAAGGLVGAATCAHRWLPFGTKVLVTNLANAHQAILTVNDRGPFVRGRIVDVSAGAAGTLGMLHSGTAPVRVQVVGRSG